MSINVVVAVVHCLLTRLPLSFLFSPLSYLSSFTRNKTGTSKISANDSIFKEFNHPFRVFISCFGNLKGRYSCTPVDLGSRIPWTLEKDSLGL